MKKILHYTLLILMGWIFVIIAVVATFLPLLPTTPFLIAALFFFAKSSPRFHQMLLNNRWFGEGLKDWEENKVMKRETKIKATKVIIVSFAITLIIFYQRPQLQMGLVGMATILLFFIWRMREIPLPKKIEEDME